MNMVAILSGFDRPDLLAVSFIVLCWFLIGFLIEHPPQGRPSVSALMAEYRREWMRQFVTRQPRIFDANVIDSLRQGTAFLASACIIALGGGVAMIGNSDQLADVAKDLSPAVVTGGIVLRVLLSLLFLANALLKFIWANRLFGYCAILMAAVPNDPDHPMAYHRAGQAAEVNITAARAFNDGLRSVYFALGALAWLLGAVPLIIATLLTVGTITRREFASRSRQVMLSTSVSSQ
jgi:uncharacterized membrane protein